VWLATAAGAFEGALGVWVARRREIAAIAASEAGARLGILDDGFQHRALRRDGEVVCLSGRAPFGNGRLLPAGPLREPPEALRRANRVVVGGIDPAATGEPQTTALLLDQVRPFLRPEATIHTWHGVPALRMLRGDPPSAAEGVLLLAGIAHPERLLDSLRTLGLPVAAHRWFPDHHRFRPGEVEAWLTEVTRSGRGQAGTRILVVTEKDWVRLESVLAGGAAVEAVPRLGLLEQRWVWNEAGAGEDWAAWLRAVADRVTR
jgi:tetraacyldisaccharide 4'-kinase